MLFTSLEFVLFILIVFVLYYLLPHKLQWVILLIASLFFYYCASPKYLIFIGITALTAYVLAIINENITLKRKAYLKEHKSSMSDAEKKTYKAGTAKRVRLCLVMALLINLGILASVKYTNFVIENINAIKGGEAISFVNIIVPMGISFYTFQTVSYSIDVSRGDIKAQRNFFKFLLFVSFFPQLVQGPISRYGDLSQTLYSEHKFDFREVCLGFIRILWGYFKKLVVADRLAIPLTSLTSSPEEYRGFYVFIVMMFYAAQLYCDFTGGIDITIGVAQLLGVKVKENFIMPYFSKNIKEYWNRWHITMGTWFTDYIFYPLSVSPKMLKLSRWSRAHLGEQVGKRVTVYIACFAVWLATGIWHGAAWYFVVWGLMNFAVIMISQELEPLYAKFHARFHLKSKKGYVVFEIIRTFLLMSALKLFDCYRNVRLTFKMFFSIFTDFNLKDVTGTGLTELGITGAEYLVCIVAVILIFLVSLYRTLKGREIRESLFERYPLYLLACALLLISITVLGVYGIGYDSTSFIYNQF